MSRRKKIVNESACDDRMLETIRRSEIFESMTDYDFDCLMNIIRPYYADYKRHESLVHENELLTKLAIVYSGKFISIRNDYSGKATVIKEYNPIDIIGLNVVFSKTKSCPTLVQATAPVNCVLFVDLKPVVSPTFPDKRLQYVMHTNLMRAIAGDSVKDIYKIDIITKKTIRERVLAYLFIVMKKSKQSAFRVDMDRERLAQYLGVTRSALSHELSKMKKEGLIECDRDWFEISEKCIEEYSKTRTAESEEQDTE